MQTAKNSEPGEETMTDYLDMEALMDELQLELDAARDHEPFGIESGVYLGWQHSSDAGHPCG